MADASTPPPDGEADVPTTPRTRMGVDCNQVTAGVLTKFVNFGTGWRPRLFVLRRGVLQYYKLDAADVPALLDGLRREGRLALVGAQVGVLEAAGRRLSSPMQDGSLSGAGAVGPATSAASLTPPPTTSGMLASPASDGRPSAPASAASCEPRPAAEVAMQVCTFALADADYRKFYVHSGTTTLRLRAETREDAWAWLAALRQAKAAWGTPAPTASADAAAAAAADAELGRMEAAARDRLTALGVGDEAVGVVAGLLATARARVRDAAASGASARAALMARVASLEDAKRQLETELVVDRELVNQGMGGVVGGLGGRAPGRPPRRPGAAPAAASPAPSPTHRSGPSGAGPSATASDASASASDDEAADVFYDAPDGGAGAGVGGGPSSPRAAAGSAPPASPRGSGSKKAVIAAQAAQALADLRAASDGAEPGAAPATPAWLAAARAAPLPSRRTAMPRPVQTEKSVSLWSIIKECVGKDLSRVCLPVYFNEPLSALQKTAEDMEYSQLLDAARACPPGSVDRMLRVAAFAVSGYSGTAGRTNKPFNPLLGETYELLCPDRGFRFVAEKVVHHPTVIAAHAQGAGWMFSGDADVRSKFWGRSIELTPVGVLTLVFDDGEEFTWNKVTSSINNLIIGKIYIDHGGIMRVRSSTGLVAKLKFKEQGLLSLRTAEAHAVKGHLELDGLQLPAPLIEGKWDQGLDALHEDGRREVLWRVASPPLDPTRYNLTRWAIVLNEVTPVEAGALAPTDCRLRPDQAALEVGEYDRANAEKQRLEIKQRAARRAAEAGEPLHPRWFRAVPGARPGVQPCYCFTDEYWDCRARGKWPGCRDIFGQDRPPAVTGVEAKGSANGGPAPLAVTPAVNGGSQAPA